MKSTGVYWLPEIPASWAMRGAWSMFSESDEIADAAAPVLTPSKEFGVVTRDQYMELSGARPQQNFATTHLMRAVHPGQFIITMGSFESGLEYSEISGKITPHYRVLNPARECDHGYFRWLFKSAPFIDGLSGLATEIRKGQEINFTKFSRLTLPLPPLDQQRGIAAYLDSEIADMNAMGSDLDKLIITLEERRKNRIRLTVRSLVDAKEHGNASLQQAASITSGSGFPVSEQGHDGLDIPFYKVNALGRADPDGVIRFQDHTISTDTADRLGARIIPAGSVVMAKIGAALLLGRVRLLERAACIDNNCVAITPGPNLDSRYLFYVLHDLDMERLVNPSTVPFLNEALLRNHQIPLPQIDEQRRIAAELDSATAAIDAMAADAQSLKVLLSERRSALITEIVTGRKEVPAT